MDKSTDSAKKSYNKYYNDKMGENASYGTYNATSRPRKDEYNQSHLYGRASQLPPETFSESELSSSRMAPSEDQRDQIASLGAALASWLSEHILLHPYVVLRRQCQVNHDSSYYHLTPLFLFQPIINIQAKQGIGCMFKGVVSSLVVKAIGYGSETIMSEVTPLPKEVNRRSSLKKIAQHLLLKCLSCAIVTPLYATSLVETVQAIDNDIEHPGLVEWLKECAARMWSFTVPSGSRQLVIWKIILPCMAYGVCHYVISSLARYNAVSIIQSNFQRDKYRNGSMAGDASALYETYYPELLAGLIGNLLADVTLYPLETVLHRLCIQGTRTIIDNTDTGRDVKPINTSYEGTVDCVRSVFRLEGVAGFYKGFGALTLQYMMHRGIIVMTRWFIERLSERDTGAPVLGTEFSRLQRVDEEFPLDGARHYPDSSFPSHAGEQPSFGMDRSFATSTPYTTPSSNQSYQYHTGTGSAQV